jgi:hypothetical protein
MELPHMIARCEAFTTYGALRAEWTRSVTGGQLPTEHWQRLHADLRDGESAYVVYSYSTPIAWFTHAWGWRVPQVRYSVTTSKHQGRLYRLAVAA